MASEVEVVEAEQTTVIRPNLLSESGPMLLSLKDAGKALGIPYSAVYELTNRGDIEHTKIGSRKYISRESLMAFIKENTHRGVLRLRPPDGTPTGALGRLLPDWAWPGGGRYVPRPYPPGKEPPRYA